VSDAVERVLREFGEIVRPDGGSVELIAVEGETLRVAYRPGHNEQCASCVISPENLRDMLLDVLPQHDPSIRRVEVSCP
jgi:Fe-S cluster biogenesis protein NfuA